MNRFLPEDITHQAAVAALKRGAFSNKKELMRAVAKGVVARRRGKLPESAAPGDQGLCKHCGEPIHYEPGQPEFAGYVWRHVGRDSLRGPIRCADMEHFATAAGGPEYEPPLPLRQESTNRFLNEVTFQQMVANGTYQPITVDYDHGAYTITFDDGASIFVQNDHDIQSMLDGGVVDDEGNNVDDLSDASYILDEYRGVAESILKNRFLKEWSPPNDETWKKYYNSPQRKISHGGGGGGEGFATAGHHAQAAVPGNTLSRPRVKVPPLKRKKTAYGY